MKLVESRVRTQARCAALPTISLIVLFMSCACRCRWEDIAIVEWNIPKYDQSRKMSDTKVMEAGPRFRIPLTTMHAMDAQLGFG